MSVGQQNGDRQGQQGTERISQEWDAAKNDAQDAAAAAAERGREFFYSARDQAAGYVDRRKDDMAQSVADVADSLRETTQSFEDRPNIKAFVDSAADGLDQLADSIRQRTFSDMYADVEDLMRRRPTTAAIAAVAVGFLFARFIKSSAEEARFAETQRRRSPSYSPPPPRPASSGTQAGQRGAASRAGV